MATKKSDSKQSTWDKIISWYAKQSYAVGIIYSVGASVVIIGALFKILHWPGASQVLMVGMFTEAFLFVLGIFEKPHATYHWENVYPQLLENEEHLAPVETKASVTAGVSALSDVQVKDLQQGIESLGKAATQLASLGEVATVSNGLIEKMQVAGKAAEAFAGTQDTLVAATAGLAQQYQTIQGEVETVVGQAKHYTKTVTEINAQLASLNAAYELQLKDIQAQATTTQAHTSKLQAIDATLATIATQTQQLQQTTTASTEVATQYLAGQKKLAEQIADLNKVYGNMLNAL